MPDQIPDWMAAQLKEAVQYKLSDGSRPLDPAQRGEAVAILLRAVDPQLPTLADLPALPAVLPDWLGPTVQKAMAYHITDGLGMDQGIARAEVFAIAIRAWARVSGADIAATDEVAAAQQHGLTDGTRAQDPALRGEVIAIALRLYKQFNKVTPAPAASAGTGFPNFGAPETRKQRYDHTDIVWANQHPAFVKLATGALNRGECEQLINSHFPGLVDCMRPTLDAEGYDWLRNTAGNFDGTGVSIGCVQWNIGMSTLQPLLREMSGNHDAVWQQVFRDGRADGLAANMDSLAWVVSNVCPDGKHMQKDWGVDWDMLCATAEFQAIQLTYVSQGYWGEAQTYARQWGLKTKKGLATAFNAHVQMGWFATDSLRSRSQWAKETGLSLSDYASGGAFLEAVRQQVTAWPDDKKIPAFMRVFGEQSNPEWKQNVMGRFQKILDDSTITYDPWE